MLPKRSRKNKMVLVGGLRLILLFMSENALSAQIMGLLRRFEGQVRAAGQRNWRWVKEVWQQVWRVDEPKMALVYG
jgi:hypothetical protein